MITLIIAYVLNIVDYVFTSYWVKHYGIGVETNPFGRWLFENGVAGLFKIGVVGVLFLLLWALVKSAPRTGFVPYIILAVYGAITVYHSIILIYLSTR